MYGEGPHAACQHTRTQQACKGAPLSATLHHSCTSEQLWRAQPHCYTYRHPKTDPDATYTKSTCQPQSQVRAQDHNLLLINAGCCPCRCCPCRCCPCPRCCCPCAPGRPYTCSACRRCSSGCSTAPQPLTASTRASTSASLCAADRLTRSLHVPAGTVGGLMAGTWKPRRSSLLLRATAACSEPTTRGMTGLWAGMPSAVPSLATSFSRCCLRHDSW